MRGHNGRGKFSSRRTDSNGGSRRGGGRTARGAQHRASKEAPVVTRYRDGSTRTDDGQGLFWQPGLALEAATGHEGVDELYQGPAREEAPR